MWKLLLLQTHNKLSDSSSSDAGPRLWNDLPPRQQQPWLSFDSFRQSLKSYLLGDWTDSTEFKSAIQMNLSIYLCVCTVQKLKTTEQKLMWIGQVYVLWQTGHIWPLILKPIFLCLDKKSETWKQSVILCVKPGTHYSASAAKAKAGMVHSVNGCTRGVQVKLWDPLRTHAIPECLRGVITTRCYTNSRLPYLTLPYYLCSRPVVTVDVFDSHKHGLWTWVPVHTTHFFGPCSRVVCTGLYTYNGNTS